jgi:ectoine hydroxylase-related dioxygenase (phytanoyl-CoA dioxygenase family)
MHKIIFSDKRDQANFDKNGYLVVPMLSEDEVRFLREIFDGIRPEKIEGIYSNIYNNPEFDNAAIAAKIESTIGKYLPAILPHFKITGGTYLAKGLGLGSICNLHQDWNNVDESTYTSVNIWCPLVDVDEHNGCLQVLPGTHLLPLSIRSANIPLISIPAKGALAKKVVSVPMKAGEACIYAHNLFHGLYQQPHQ